MLCFGYNTNGFAHHRLDDALAILADLGYGSVALTLDHHVLNPFESDLLARTDSLRKLLEKLKLRCVVETGRAFSSIRAENIIPPWLARHLRSENSDSIFCAGPLSSRVNWAPTPLVSGQVLLIPSCRPRLPGSA